MAEKKKVETPEQETPVQETPVQEKTVKIRLPMIPGVDKQEALYVGVNNRSWVIARGIEMEVPECVVEVIEHSENEAFNAAQFRAAHTV